MANIEFRSYSDALRYCEESCVIYLPEHALEIKHLLPFLRPLPEGLYLPKSHKPILTMDRGLFWLTPGSIKPTHVTSLEEIITDPKSSLYDRRGDMVFSYQQLTSKAASYLSTKPDKQAVLYKALIAVIYDFFDKRRGTFSSLAEYQLSTLFKKDDKETRYSDLVDDLISAPVNLRNILMNFYKTDTCKTYTVRHENTEVKIEKGLDFRILEYYRLTDKNLDEDDEAE